MKSKWSLIILSVAIILVVAAGLFSYNTTQRILVRTSLFDLSAQLSDMHKWEKWNKTLFHDTTMIRVTSRNTVTFRDDEHFDLHINNPASFQLSGSENGIKNINYITMQPVGHSDDSTQIEWTVSQRAFSWLWGKITGTDQVAAQLKNLKTFTEDQTHIYGYPIRLTTVQDRIICTVRKVVDKDSAKSNIRLLLNKLKSFLAKEGIVINKDYYYVSYMGKNSRVELAVGIPVQKEHPTHDGYEFLKFPENGRLLVGTYQGDYNNISAIYAAMDKYSSEKGLTKVAQPMEAYQFDAILSGNIKMQLIYPVY